MNSADVPQIPTGHLGLREHRRGGTRLCGPGKAMDLIMNFTKDEWDLVGGIATPLKYEFVNWDDEIPNLMEKQHSCSKPPTRDINGIIIAYSWHLNGI